MTRIVRSVPVLKYETFIGEYSKQWVGVAIKRGEVVYSVQRATQERARWAVETKQPRFEFERR